MKLVRPRLSNVVDLRRSVPPLVHRVGKRVYGHFRYRVQSQDQVGRKPAVQVRQRVIRFQAVNDIAVGEGGQPVELDVAVSVGSADEVVATARRVHQRPGRELQRVGQITAWIRKV